MRPACPSLTPSPHCARTAGCRARSARWAGATTLLCGALVALSACSGRSDLRATGFWLRAAAPLQVGFDPPPPAGAPGVVSRHIVRGEVASVRQLTGGTSTEIAVRDEAGATQLVRLQLGARRTLALSPGDVVRVHRLARRHTEDDGEDVGVAIWAIQARAAATLEASGDPEAAAPDGGAATAGALAMRSRAPALERLLVAIDSRGVLEEEGLPPLLLAITTTTMMAYHDAGPYGQECDEMRQHSWFRYGRSGWLREVAGQRHALDPRLLAPGSRLVVDDGVLRFDVLLVDNRQTTQSACRVASEPFVMWAALAVDTPKRQLAPAGATAP